MFEQHPVPQNISSYSFRLVGDMTIKQFFQLAGGALISLIVYASPLPGFIKWPFVIFFALLGAALAFLPFQDRPLEQWIAAFFRSIYAPTIYTWKRADTPLVQFQPDTSAVQPASSPPPPPAVPKPAFLSHLDEAEKNLLSTFTGLFSLSPKPPQVPPTPPPQPQEKGPLTIPATPPQPVTPQPRSVPVSHAAPSTAINPEPARVTTTLPTQQSRVTAQAQFSPDAAPPIPPSQPNIVVGQVMDSASKIVDGAILEIKDSMGRPVRALKTNKAGHFLIVTPLTNGEYTINIEKESLEFESLKIKAEGAIIPPIAIKSKNAKSA